MIILIIILIIVTFIAKERKTDGINENIWQSINQKYKQATSSIPHPQTYINWGETLITQSSLLDLSNSGLGSSSSKSSSSSSSSRLIFFLFFNLQIYLKRVREKLYIIKQSQSF
jgi:hypothetical protein